MITKRLYKLNLMDQHNYIVDVERLTREHSGYSKEDGAIWIELSNKVEAVERKIIYHYLLNNKQYLKPDIYEVLKSEGIFDKFEKQYIQALAAVDPEETEKALSMFQEGLKTKRKPNESDVENLLEAIKSDEDAINFLVVLGPKGIQDLERNLLEAYLTGKTEYSLQEFIEILHDYIRIKNVIANENVEYMKRIIEIYARGMKWVNHQRMSKMERTQQYFDKFINN